MRKAHENIFPAPGSGIFTGFPFAPCATLKETHIGPSPRCSKHHLLVSPSGSSNSNIRPPQLADYFLRFEKKRGRALFLGTDWKLLVLKKLPGSHSSACPPNNYK